MFPIAQNAEPFELLALKIDILARERFAAFADFERRKFARFFHDFVFDGQAVAVPARNIWRAFAEHGLRFHNEIFEDFVERRAHVNVAVGERRVRRAGRITLDLCALFGFADRGAFPPTIFSKFRLARRQIRLHRKIRARQVERVFVILTHRGRATLTLAAGQINEATRVHVRQIETSFGGQFRRVRLKRRADYRRM